MKLTTPLALAALAISIAALYFSLQAPPPAPQATQHHEGWLINRVEVLEDEVARLQRLQRAQSLLATRPASPLGEAPRGEVEPPPPPAVEGSTSAALVEALDEDDEVKARLSAAVSEAIERREEERHERFSERMMQRKQAALQTLADEVNLDEAQLERLSTAMTEEHAQIHRLFREREAGGSFREVRAKIHAIRAETDEQAGALLDEEQLAAYEEMREQELPRFAPRQPPPPPEE